MEIHTVKEGDTLWSVASEYGMSAEMLQADNQLMDSKLAVGQTLVIQEPLQTHTVQRGDTLTGIADMYQTTPDALLRLNPVLHGQGVLYPGQILTVRTEEERLGTFSVNGYAYPFIDRTLLHTVLPYLSELTPFTYGLDIQGNIYAPEDAPLIKLADQYRVSPVMHISTLRADGYFDNTLSEAVMTDVRAQDRFVEQVLQTMREKGYRILDIDFEFVPAAQASVYAQLVARLRTAVNAMGGEVMVALAPKTSRTQKGLLYEGHDYRLLGEAADRLLLMTYEWGYTYGPPMAVAPLNKVEEVVRFAVGEIPAQKLYLGIPAYGYEWSLPYRQGTAAKSLAPQEAVRLAISADAQILYEEEQQAPYFYYTDKTGEHVVWFEDARSVAAKYALAAQYGLYGVSFWNLMRPFPQSWLVLNNRYQIRGR
ncbi:MAG: LysM peptidoglycan-binding domain-containing protein [Clostridia bacterium]|nr:LysM peptidoglycan-binding domain-containing protein [Clostridia bacterium]